MVFLAHVIQYGPLDLNNLPDDFIKEHGKQPLGDSNYVASGIYRKDKNNTKDESERVYECRFCSLKFLKSQALGGHMNRHRQERETEILNQARQLVFSSDNMLALPPHQLVGQPAVHNYAANFKMGGSVYPTTLFSTILSPPPSLSPLLPLPPPSHQHTSTTLPSPLGNTYSSQYSNSQSINHYFVDHYVSSNPHFNFQNLSCATMPTP